jgi:hypothetical protein
MQTSRPILGRFFFALKNRRFFSCGKSQKRFCMSEKGGGAASAQAREKVQRND